MRAYSLGDLERTLQGLGVGPGDMLCVHSSLLRLGRMDGISVADIPDALLAVFLKLIGPQGTLAVPAFNFDFCRGEPFVREQTPAIGMGSFSEYVRCLPYSCRSAHPMQSLAAIGARAAELCRGDTLTAFDPGGAFDFMVKESAKLVLLGADFNAASVIHLAEQQVEVPYRHLKQFTGACEAGGERRDRTYAMHVRDLELDPRLEMSPVGDELRARNQLGEEALGMGRVMVASLPDVVSAAEDLLRSDPWCLVSNRRTT